MPNVDEAAESPLWLAGLTPARCLLCDDPTAFAGVFVLGPGAAQSSPRAGRRYVVYGLCRGCGADAEVLATVIDRVLAARLASAGM